MDPYPVHNREFPIDPYYASVNFRIYSIKVIPIIDEDAKIFPSWHERKLVWLELIFNPFTLETIVLLHNGQNAETKLGQSRSKGKSDGVVICSSYFIPVMSSENQRHVVLWRVEGVQDRLLGFYENPSPASSPQSLTSKIADRILAALMATRKDTDPSLELCFENNTDAKSFYHTWLLAFGREVDDAQFKKCADIFNLCKNSWSAQKGCPPPEAVPRAYFGTPVSLQTPTNASNFILPPLIYEKALCVTEANLSLKEPAFINLPCHDYGGGNTGNPRVVEVFIPYDKLLKCKIPSYPKLNWRVDVTSAAKDNNIFQSFEMVIEDSAVMMLREPLIPLEERKKHLEGLKREKKVDEWVNKNEKKKYWWLRLSFLHRDNSRMEMRLATISIRFIVSSSIAMYTPPIYAATRFPNNHPTTFNPLRARAIEEVFLGYRLGRLLPDDVVRSTDITPSVSLFAEQAKIFNHVLSHDFTLVDTAPGTGKSKVTTDIILGFLLRGKQVLVINASENGLDLLAKSVLNAMPLSDVRATEAVARLRSRIVNRTKILDTYQESILETMSVEIAFRRPYGKPFNQIPQAIEAKAQLDKATVIFMTTKMAERLDSFYGVSRRTFDLIILDDANTCSESTGLQLVKYPFANAFRWLVIGCSKGISPGVSVSEFKEIEACGSWFNRLLRHPEFRLNPLRLTKQGRLRRALYEPINRMFFGNTITSTSDTPQEAGDHELCMGFINTRRICKKKARPDVGDEELLEMTNYRREQSYVFALVQKIHKLTPHASIVIICHTELQKALMYAEWEKIKELKRATILIDIIDDFASREVDYAIVHIPRWKDSYEYSDDPGRFVITMTRARKAVFAVGNLKNMTEYENKRGTWAKNPWNGWLTELNKSAHGAVFEDVAEVDLTIQAKDLATFKKGRAEMGAWLGERYSKEERAKLRNYW